MPWIFWLDADEVLTKELAEELKAEFSGGVQAVALKLTAWCSFKENV